MKKNSRVDSVYKNFQLIPFQGGPKMNISLLSAYEHPDRIYVLMTSLNKYGDTIYCRYFDHQRGEISPPIKTVVFPEFIALCPRRGGARYMSLTDEPTDAYEFPLCSCKKEKPFSPNSLF
uniref:Sema domain-containing protein n=1 Tax=Angiostrongylus cantonensis TaxID=6313 RepID=A0A0K0D8Z7_ANGCA